MKKKWNNHYVQVGIQMISIPERVVPSQFAVLVPLWQGEDGDGELGIWKMGSAAIVFHWVRDFLRELDSARDCFLDLHDPLTDNAEFALLIKTKVDKALFGSNDVVLLGDVFELTQICRIGMEIKAEEIWGSLTAEPPLSFGICEVWMGDPDDGSQSLPSGSELKAFMAELDEMLGILCENLGEVVDEGTNSDDIAIVISACKEQLQKWKIVEIAPIIPMKLRTRKDPLFKE